jgi:nicotinate-nucleotide pyrophosphorylase (carboxylating)
MFQAGERAMGIQPGPAERENLLALLAMAKREDLGDGDVTSSLLPEGVQASSRFVARDRLVFCGGAFLDDIARAYDPRIKTTLAVESGERVQPGTVLAHWAGPAGPMMSAERIALNFLQRLSGVATLTGEYVAAVEGTPAKVYDTRKTTPGWRELEKYAVRTGGGVNHRKGLYDAVMFKDNHLAVMGRISQTPIAALKMLLDKLHQRRDQLAFVMLEVDTLAELDVALTLNVDIILLDNMTPGQLRQAVALRDQAGLRGKVALEASGGITIETVRDVAEAGVDRISIGALTHSASAVDIALDTSFD